MKLKKTLSFILAVITVLMMASCTSNRNEKTSDTEPMDNTAAQETEIIETEKIEIKYVPGDVISFGRYEQDNNLSNSAEPIDWIVLDVKDDSYLLISRYGLDAIPYNETGEAVAWEESTLCRWLNHDFAKAAFTDVDKEYILDNGASDQRITCLSVDEVNTYFPGMYAKRTDTSYYAQIHGAYAESGVCGWWLRNDDPGNGQLPRINIQGELLTDNSGEDAMRTDYSVRPVIALMASWPSINAADAAAAEESTDNETVVAPQPPIHIESTSMLMINADTGEHIWEKDAYSEIAPASLTKVMTTIVALENVEDMNAEFTFTNEIIQYLKSLSSSVAGFRAGETVTAKDLIYAAMLPSGGDGATGIAVLTAGSVENFVDLMNKKVEELGLVHTHFANPTGLDEENHYSCAYDMCQIMKYAIQNESFLEIINTVDYTTAATSYHPNGIKLRNLMQEGLTNNSISAPYLVGGKPGFTDAAKLCLVTYAEHNGSRYILATLGAGNGEKLPQYHFTDMDAIYSFYFSQDKK